MKIFWGIFCHAHWYDVTAEMLRCVKSSCAGTPIEIHATGSQIQVLELKSLLTDFGVEASVFGHDRNLFEYYAIHALWENALAFPNGRSCYIHSKGVTGPSPTRSKWRWMLESKILLQLSEREKDLDEVDVVGCAYKEDWNCFAGNWWCARNDWVLNLEEPKEDPDRFIYEKWVTKGSPRIKELTKRCSGGPPDHRGEPCSALYYNRQEEVYRSALLLDYPLPYHR